MATASPTEARVVVVTPATAKPVEAIEIDDLVALLDSDGGNRKKMAEARQWVAAQSKTPRSLKSMRLAAGMSQSGLAAAINMSQPNVCAFETGGRTPSRSTVKKLAVSLGVSPEEIYFAIEESHE